MPYDPLHGLLFRQSGFGLKCEDAMVHREATLSSIDDEIKNLASPFRPTASTIAMCFYSLACIDFFATAVGAPSWAATIVALLRNTGVVSLSSEFVFVFAGVIFLVIAYLANRLSRWAQTLKGDLRATIPSKEWADGRQIRPIVAWLVMLPIMTGVTFKLASVVDAYATFGIFFSSILLVVLTMGTSWIAAAMAVGLSRDRDAIKGLSFTLLSYLFIVLPFGAKLYDVIPALNHPGFYSPIVSNVTWAYAVIFYIVIIARILLIFENEGDYEQIRLLISDDTKEKPIVDIYRPELIFEKPVYLLIVPQRDAKIMTFVRDITNELFLYIPMSKIADARLRIDRQQIRIFSLTAIAAQFSGEFSPIRGLIEVSGRLTCNIMESEFAENGDRKFTPHQLQVIQEIFAVDNLRRFRSAIVEIVQTLTDEIFKPMTQIEGFISLVRTNVDSATMKGESQARYGANLLNSNSAAAIAAEDSVAKALDKATMTIMDHFKAIEEAESRITKLPAEIIEKCDKRVSDDIKHLCDSSNDDLPSKVAGFNRVMGISIEIDPIAMPQRLIEIKTKLQDATGFSAEKIKEIQLRADGAAKEQTRTIVDIATAPNLRDGTKSNTLNILKAPASTVGALGFTPDEDRTYDDPDPM